jgi:hypothetical protein
MDHVPEYENTAMMDDVCTPAVESLSPASDSEVIRIRKFLLIILSICLVSFYCISCLLLDDDVKTGSGAQSLFSLKSMSLSALHMYYKK